MHTSCFVSQHEIVGTTLADVSPMTAALNIIIWLFWIEQYNKNYTSFLSNFHFHLLDEVFRKAAVSSPEMII